MIFLEGYKRGKAKRTSTYYYPRSSSTFNENSDLNVSITNNREEGGAEERDMKRGGRGRRGGGRGGEGEEEGGHQFISVMI